MSTIIITLLVFYSIVTRTTTISRNHRCYIESYIEKLNIRHCLNTPIEIQTTRCRGQCYSEDFLIYDWQSEPTHYRHKHHIYCCSPNMTISREIPIICYNNQEQIIKYPFVSRCECKLCTDNCHG